jgi:hypothetical protein
MILVLCDDIGIYNTAQTTSLGNQMTFGNVYRYVTPIVPQLGRNEDLFIIAHGMQGEIGNEVGPPAWNALQLLEYLMGESDRFNHGALHSIFPDGYRGNIYLSACYTQNVERGGMSIAENFGNLAGVQLSGSRVYGQRGGVTGTIPSPGDRAWDSVAKY